MRVIEHTIEVPGRGQPITLWGIGDTHKGAMNHRQDILKRDIKRIADDPFAIWFGLGDFGDLILPGDKRYRQGCAAQRYLDNCESAPHMVVDDLADDLSVIARQCGGIIEGNHDSKFAAHHYTHVPVALANKLQVPYLGASALIRVRVMRPGHAEVVTVHVSHGAGGGRTAGAAAGYLERQMDSHEADVYFCGHFHRKSVVRKRRTYVPERGEVALRKRERIGVAVASYYDQCVEDVTDYAEEKALPIWDLGMAGVRFTPDVRTFEVIA